MKKLLADTTKTYYGQFGRMHIARYVQNENEYYNYRSFITRLMDNDTTLKSGITAVALVYSDERKEYPKDKDDWGKFASSFSNNKAPLLTGIDSVNYPEIAKKYDYALLFKDEKSFDTYSNDFIDLKDIGTLEAGLIFNSNPGMSYINEKLGSNYPQSLLLLHLRICVLADNNLYFNFGGFYGVNTPKREINDSVFIKFGKSSLYSNLGYNFYIGKRIVIAPYAGIGIDFAHLSYTLFKNIQDSVSYSRAAIHKKYSNNAFIVNTGLNIKIFPTENYFLTAECNYSYDLSNKSWIYNKHQQIVNFPEYSHTGLYYMLGMGFTIH